MRVHFQRSSARVAGSVAAALVVLLAGRPASAQSGMQNPPAPQAQQQSTAHKPDPDPTPFTFEAAYKIEQISVASDKHDFKMQLTRDLSKRTSITGGYEQESNFNELDGQVNMGVTHQVNHRVSITGNFTQGIAADLLAGQVYDGQATIMARPHFIPQLEYSLSSFTTTHKGVSTKERLHLIGIGAEMPINKRSAFVLKYQYSQTSRGDDGDHSGSFEYAYTPERKLTLILGGGYGSERVLAHTHTEIFRNSDTLSAGLAFKYRLAGGRGVKGGYEYQDRKNAYKVHVLNIGFYTSF